MRILILFSEIKYVMLSTTFNIVRILNKNCQSLIKMKKKKKRKSLEHAVVA